MLSLQASASPAAKGATPTDSTAFNTFTPPTDVKYGLNAGDLLSDQVNLTYQIFNIQMILDRSISDRLRDQYPRLQVLLGFDVTLDPLREAVDSAAIVEVSVRMHGSEEPVSVVALMPQEHTYNAAALSTKSSAFGGSAVTQIATVAYSSRRRSQTYYLFRDSDTVAFERGLHVPRRPTQDEANTTCTIDQVPETHFGWQFRPVLGRRSVSPGSRQMFAVLALPATDLPTESAAVENLEIRVKTHWRKYDRSTLTTTEANHIPWWTQAGHVLGLGIPSVYPPVSVGGGSCYLLPVPKTARFQKDLSPVVGHVSWSWVGKKQLLVSVSGKNFFNDTRVAVAGKVLDSEPALRIKSDQAFEIMMDPADLSDGSIIGRYGSAVPLVGPRGSPPVAIAIHNVTTSTPIGGFFILDVYLQRKDGGNLTTDDLPRGGYEAKMWALAGSTGTPTDVPAPPLEPIIAFNGTPIPGPWSLINLDTPNPKTWVKCAASRSSGAPTTKRVLARAVVSTDLIKSTNGLLTVTYPFSDTSLRADFPLNDPNSLIEAQRLADTSQSANILLINKLHEIGWSPAWSAVLDGKTTLGATACPAPVPAPVPVPLPPPPSAAPAGPGQPPPVAAPVVPPPPPLAPGFCFQSTEYAILTVPVKDSPLGDKLLLYESCYGGTYLIPIPAKANATPAAAKTPPPVNQYDSHWVTLDETSIKKPFDKAQLDGKVVTVTKEPSTDSKGVPYKKVAVFVTRAFSEKPGTLDVIFLDDKGNVVVEDSATIVINCTNCQTSTDNKETKK